ncbi:DUF4832 domain-containing protein [Cohnella sp. JJ-181]|uniref:DUF4832 domain-containing protein n=1 Tax=Cohnella rhizoplanae TaxID=2974897 RepID=UPI0022FFA833|nr:DUF4832 domain-containing protein [Cohnella sp. JJ-181]CAI6035136.1 hypothetical protein COHCIP112018_00864 [Cohnella sp. JJ-181]
MWKGRLAKPAVMLIVFFLVGSMLLMNFRLPHAAASGEWQTQTYDPNKPGLEQNPLKGFLPFSKQPSESVDPNNGFPHSMEWFYVSLRDLMTGWNTYNWAPLDAYLNDISSRGNQAVFRVYVDYPGRTTGIPQFLINGGLLTRDYDQNGNHDSSTHSLAPDWNDANLNLALRQFVAALGARYDGDPRIGFVTAGLYGFWGEWHTWPYNAAPNDWQMNQSNRDGLLTAFKDAFNTTQVLARYPYSASTSALKNAFGYHDDSFAYETLTQTTWDFWSLITQNGLQSIWQTHPIGGELYPPLQQDTGFWQTWPNQNGQNFQTSVETTHASWLMYDRVFKSSLPSQTAASNALRAHKMLGYSLYNSAVQLPDSSASSLQVNVKLQNKGVAPFYYNWPVEFGVLNASDAWVKSLGTASWNLKSVQPGGADYSFAFNANHNLPAGDYKLVMRVGNPLTGGKTLRFANTRQDANRDGWLTLSGFHVSAAATTSTTLADPPLTGGATPTPTPTQTPSPTPTPTPTPTPPSGTIVYEAEASGNTLGSPATVVSCATCSGGSKVGYVGNGGTLRFNGITAPSTGDYTVTIHYLNGEASRYAALSVNGGAGTSINFPSSGGWTTVASLVRTVHLQAGTNTLSFSQPTGYAPDFDRIAVSGGAMPLVFDNYDSANQYNSLHANDMGGGYWGDGSVSGNGSELTLSGVSWWDATFSAAETNVNLSAYTYLVYVVKSSTNGASFNVTMWDAGGAKGTKTVAATTAYQTIRIPLADFAGFDKATAIKFKHSAFTGNFTIDEIRFE